MSNVVNYGEINVTPQATPTVKVTSPSTPKIKIGMASNAIPLQPATDKRLGGVKIALDGGVSVTKDGTISIDIAQTTKKALSLFPQVLNEDINTAQKRANGQILVGISGEPKIATIEQIKGLNTKILCVESMNDTEILTLSNGDHILSKIGE